MVKKIWCDIYLTFKLYKLCPTIIFYTSNSNTKHAMPAVRGQCLESQLLPWTFLLALISELRKITANLDNENNWKNRILISWITLWY